MKNVIGISVIIFFSFVAIGFLIAAWITERKNKKYYEELFTIPDEMDYSLDQGVYHFDLEPEQVN